MAKPWVKKPKRVHHRKHRVQRFEQLEPRLLLNADWQNPARPADVNNDGIATPLDALLVLNRIRSSGSGELPERVNRLDFYYDVSGDGSVAPLDGLRVLNEIQRGLPSGRYLNQRVEGESEVAPAGFISMPLTTLGGNSRQHVDLSTTMAIGGAEFNELGVFVVDTADGMLNGIHPSSPAYADTVFASAAHQVLYSRRDIFRTTRDVTLPAASHLHVYVLQTATNDGDPSKHIRVQTQASDLLRVGWEKHAASSPWPVVGDRYFDDVIVDMQIGTPYDDNASPVLEVIANQTIAELTELTVAVLASDADLPNDELRFSLDAAPPGATINPQSGLFRWTPTEAQGPGDYALTVKVTDRAGVTDSQTFVVNVREVNEPPILAGIDNQSVDELQKLTVQATAVDPDLPANTLTYSIVSGPTGLTINPTSGLIEWTPTETQGPAIETVIVRVDDGQGASDEQAFAITVVEVNQPPVLEQIATQVINELELFEMQLRASDADLPINTLTYALVQGPAGATVDSSTGRFTWTPTEAQGPGNYEFIVRVTDREGALDTASFFVEVLEVNQAPVLGAIAHQTLTSGEPVTLSLQAGDADIPANSLTFSLDAGAAAGASIDPDSGTFSWTAPTVATVTTFLFSARVTDDGEPALSHARPFMITVTPPPVDCLFDDGLTQWEIVESGGSSDHRGTATAASCQLTLTEGDSFVTGVQHVFTVNGSPRALQFTLSGPQFDLSDQNFINDAFEVALVDADGNTLVSPFSAGRDAFLNWSEGLLLAGAQGVHIDGNTVTLQLGGIIAGIEARIIFRLVNNDRDTATSVTISDLQWIDSDLPAPLATGSNSRALPPVLPVHAVSPLLSGVDLRASASVTEPFAVTASVAHSEVAAGTTLLLSGQGFAPPTGAVGISTALSHVTVNGRPVTAIDGAGRFFDLVEIVPGVNTFTVLAEDTAGQQAQLELVVWGRTEEPTIDFTRFADITGSFSGEYFRTSFNETEKLLHVDLATRNDGTFEANVPLLVGVTNVSDPSVQLVGVDGYTPDGTPYYDYSSHIAGERLGPGELTDSPTVLFHNPNRVQFEYELVFLGKLNEAPSFISTPRIEALAGRTYTYDADAVDPDDDPLTYSLLIAPAGVTIDEDTGELSWTTTNANIGQHDVAVHVTDGRGGVVEQRYTLSVIAAPPNRPPVITSQPVTEAELPDSAFVPVTPEENDLFFVVGGEPGELVSVRFDWTIRLASFNNEFGIYAIDDARGTVAGLVPGRAGYNAAALAVDNSQVIFRSGQGAGASTSVELIAGQRYASYIIQNGTTEQYRSGTRNAFFGYEEAHGGPDRLRATFLPNGQMQFAWEDYRDFNFTDVVYTITADSLGLGQPFSYNYQLAAFDPDGDPLTYALLQAPEGMDVDAANSLVRWNPTAEQVGNHQVVVQVSDGRGGVAIQEYIVCVLGDPENHQPIIISEPGQLAMTGQVYKYPVVALDPDYDTLTYSLLEGPEGMGVDADSGLLSWSVPEDFQGMQPVRVAASDGRGGVAVQDYELAVTPAMGNARFIGTVYKDLNRNGFRDSELVAGDAPLIVFAVDVSGSMAGDFTGTAVGDVNGDGLADTRLDALVTAMELFQQRLVELGLGETATLALAMFSGEGTTVDMDPRIIDVSELMWTLTGPTGSLVTNRRFNQTDSATGLSLLDLAAGQYKFVVSAAAGATPGDYSFRVIDLQQARPLTLGEIVKTTLQPGTETEAFRFDAAAGDRFSFDMLSVTGGSTSARWRLLDPYGQMVFNQPIITDMNGVTLNHEGQYTLLLEGRILEPVPRDISFIVHPIADGHQPLQFGAVTEGEIITPGQRDTYHFTLQDRRRVYLDSLTQSNTIHWTLQGPTGILVNSRLLDRSDSADALAVLELVPGDYTLTVGANGAATGEYGFRFNDLSAAVPITPGTPVDGQLAQGNNTDFYRFDADANDRFYFDMQSLSGGNTSSRWRLIDPYGQPVFTQVLSADVDTVALDHPGTYTLLIEGRVSEATSRNYRFNVQPVQYDLQSLTLDSVIEGSITVAGERDRYAFQIEQRRLVYFDSLVNSSTLNWTLEGPTGTMVNARRFDQSDSADGHFVLDLVPGAYSLTVDAIAAATGDYRFRLADLESAAAFEVGTPIGGDLSPGYQTAIYQFDAVAGDQLSFQMESLSGGNTGGRRRLLDPYGQVVFNHPLSANPSTITTSHSGTYILLLEGRIHEPNTRSYRFLVDLVGHEPPAPLAGIPLAIGQSISGQIAAAGDSAAYRLTLTEPAQVYFDSFTHSSTLRWTFAGPQGTLVNSRRFDQADSAGGFILLDLPAGEYILTVTGSGAATGSYGFRLTDLGSGSDLPLATPIRGMLDPGVETDVYRFHASAGERFYFEMQSLSGGNTTARWRLVDPYGQVVFNQVLSAHVDAVTLPYEGAYTLLLEGRSSEPAPRDYTLVVWPVRDGEQSLPLGEAVQGMIVSPGQQQTYHFMLAEHRLVTIDSLTHSSTLNWTLQGPRGVVVNARRFDQTDSADGHFLWDLPPGSYSLTVDASGTSTGDFAFRIVELAAAEAITLGTVVSSQLSPGNKTDLYRVTASAGDRLFFHMQALSGGSTSSRWRLIDPYGQLVFNQPLSSSVDTVRVAHDGTYTLMLEGRTSESTTRDYTFVVQAVEYSDQPLALGAVVHGEIAAAGERDVYRFTLDDRQLLYLDALTNQADLNWTLEGPLGMVVNARRLDRSDSADGFSLLDLPAGNYTLTLGANGTATGTYAFRLVELETAEQLTPGLPVSGRLEAGNETHFHRFEAVAGERYYFDMLSLSGGGTGSRWRLISPYGQVVFNQNLASDVETLQLEHNGTYTLAIEGRISEIGPRDYRFNVQPVEFTEHQLVLGSLVDGQVSVPGMRNLYHFRLDDHRLVYFDSLTARSDLNWTLLGPKGAVVNTQRLDRSDSADGHFVIDLAPGDYTLTVDGVGEAMGDYRFRLSELGSATELIFNEAFSGQLTPGHATQIYRFDAAAGDRLTFQMQSLSGGNTGGRRRLIDPYGQLVFNQPLAATANTVTVNQSGTYTLLVEGRVSEPEPRDYTFLVEHVGHEEPAPLGGVSLLMGQRIEGGIAQAGDRKSYVLTLTERTTVYFDSFTNSSTLRWTLTGPLGTLVNNRRFDQSDSSGGLTLLDLPAGQHLLTVFGNGTATGEYAFRLVDLRTAEPISPGASTSGTLSPGTETSFYRFDAVAGQRYYFQMESLSGGTTSGRWRLVDPYGQVVFDQVLSSDAPAATLQHSGTHTLLLEGRVAEPVARDYTYVVWTVEPSEQTLVLGADMSGQIITPGAQDSYELLLMESQLLYVDALTRDFRFSSSPASDIDGDGVVDFIQVVRGLRANGGTHFQAGLQRAIEIFEQLSDVSTSKTLVFISDGERTDGTPGAEEVALLESMGVDVQAYAIGLDSLLSSLAVLDPEPFRFGDADELYDVFTGVTGGGIEFLEPALPNWTIYIDANDNNLFDSNEQWTRSDAEGAFIFAGLEAGAYRLRAVPQLEWTATQPWEGVYSVTVGEDQTVRAVDFGFYQSPADEPAPLAFTTAPVVSASEQELYRYDALTTSRNSQSLSFTLLAAPTGMTVHPTLGVVVWIPRPDQVGDHQVVLRVSDDRGGATIQPFTVTVNQRNSPPVMTSSPTTTATAGQTYEYRLRAQDANGDPVSYRFDEAPARMAFETVELRNSANELIEVYERLVWTPTPGDVGTSPTVTVIADDGRGGEDRQSWTLTVQDASAANVAPVFTSTPRSTARLGLSWSYLPQASDADGDAVTFSLDQAPVGMQLGPNGIITWTPPADAPASVNVTILAVDGRGEQAVQTLELQVVSLETNRAPTITSIPRTRAISGEQYAYDPIAFDPDGDPLHWSLTQAPRGMSIDPMTGAIRWTPDDQQLGPHIVAVTVTDPFLAQFTQRFELSCGCNNLPPAIVSVPPTTALTGRVYLYAARADDLERDPLSWQLTTVPAGMSIDAQTGVIRWVPTLAQLVAPHEVVIEVSDGVNTAKQQYTVVVSNSEELVDPNDPTRGTKGNRPPLITSTPRFAADTESLYTYQVTAVDLDGDDVTLSLSGTVAAGMTIDNAGLITWTPSAADVGEFVISITATDAHGAIATQGFLLSVTANRPPQITSAPVTTVVAGATYRYSVRANDPDGDPLVYRLAAAPPGMTIDRYGRILWSSSAGTIEPQPVTVVVSDNRGASTPQSYTINVLPDTQPPAVTLSIQAGHQTFGSDARVDIGSNYIVRVVATDNVAVAEIGLLVDGQRVTLDASGAVSLPASALGTVQLRATATDTSGLQGVAMGSIAIVDPAQSNQPVHTDPTTPPHPGFDPSDTRGPTVILTSPLSGTTVTNRTPITGTVDDPEDNLWYYAVYYARADRVSLAGIDLDDAAWTLLKQSTEEVIDGELAVFDPSMLTNNAYMIVVAAYDVNGRGYIQSTVVDVTGNIEVGNFRLEFTDLSIPLAGIPIEVNRVYDTLNADYEGDFGFGWSLGVQDARIFETVPEGYEFIPGRTKVYLTTPDGRRVGFTYEEEVTPLFCFKPGACVYTGFFGDQAFKPVFRPDPGVYETLTIDAPSKVARGGLSEVFGTVGRALGGVMVNPSVYTLTTKDGTQYKYDQFKGLQTITDLNGNFATFTDAGIHHSSGVSIQFIRDHRGRITEIIDPSDNSIRYEYNAAGDLVKVTNQLKLETRYEYLSQPAHYLDQAFDSLGRRMFQAVYGQDADTRQFVFKGIIDALGNRVDQRDFDTANNTGIIRDGNGNATTLIYDDRGNVLNEIDPAGNITFREYNDPRNPDLETRIIDRLGNVTDRQYDARGNLLSIIERGSDDQPLNPPIETQFTYDAGNRVTSIKNALGHATAFVYDGKGNLIQIINAEGNSATFTYDAKGQRTSFTDFNGNTTTLDYAAACPCGSPSKVTYADGTYQTYEYNQFGQVTKERVFEADGSLVEYRESRFDEAGRQLVAFTGAYGDPDHPPTLVASFYDGHLLNYEVVIHPDSLSANGVLLESPATPIDQRKSRITDYEYDANDRLIRQIDAMGGVVEFRYDANGNRVLLQDPVGNITTWTYDTLNRVAEERDPFYWVDFVQANSTLDMEALLAAVVEENKKPSTALLATNQGAPHVRSFAYDAEGNQSKVIDRNNRRREFDYDHVGRLLEERWYNPVDHLTAPSALVETINFSYDVLGNLLTAVDSNSRYLHTYDVLNRLTSVDNNPLGDRDVPRVILSYDYDAQGNVISTSDDSGVTVASEYDSRNRLAVRRWYDAAVPEGQEPDVDHARVEFFYNAAGREIEIRRYSDLDGDNLVGRTVRSYDLAGRSNLLNHVNAIDEVIAGYDYDFDFSGLLINEERTHQNPQYVQSIQYKYDLTGQLVEALFSAQDDELYQYDANGNRLFSRVGTDERTYTTGSANYLTSDGQYRYEYDGEGNQVRRIDLTTGTTRIFFYDHRNRLVGVDDWSSEPGDPTNPTTGVVLIQSVEYAYDALGRRIARSVATNWENSQIAERESFVHSQNNVWADFNEHGESVARYLFGDFVDRGIARYRESDGMAWYLTDQLRTIRDISLISTTQLKHVGFGVFGNVIGHVNLADAGRYLFQGREYDPNTSLYHFRSRFANTSARFISEDSLRFDSGETNLLRFLENNSLNLTDPFGEASLTEFGFKAAAFITRVSPSLGFLATSLAIRFQNVAAFVSKFGARIAGGYSKFGRGFDSSIRDKRVDGQKYPTFITDLSGGYRAAQSLAREIVPTLGSRGNAAIGETSRFKVILRGDSGGGTTLQIFDKLQQAIEVIRFGI